jgi:MYXO-CTERM domain-containing protein
MKATSPFIALALAAAATLLPGTARATIVLNIEQQGSDVVASYSGSWDSWAGNVIIVNDTAVFSLGMLAMPGGNNKEYVNPGLTLQSGAWTAVLSRPDVATGDDFGFTDSFAWAPLNYTAGDPIEGSLLFENTDLVTMGFTLGDSGSFSGGGNTVNFSVTSAAPVPEPGTWAAAALLVGGAALARWRRRQSAAKRKALGA